MAHEEFSNAATSVENPVEMQQLVMVVPEASRAKPSRTETNRDGFVKLDDGVGEVLVAAGSFRGIGATNVTTETPMTVLMVKLNAGAKLALPTMAGGCFLYGLTTELKVNESCVVPRRVLAVVASGTDELVVANVDSAATAHFIFANGARVDDPWVKLLTGGGFLLARDEAEALRQEALFKKVGLNSYGRD